MACVHNFDCTCLDYAIRNVACSHIHAVSMAGPVHVQESRDAEECNIEEKREGLAK